MESLSLTHAPVQYGRASHDSACDVDERRGVLSCLMTLLNAVRSDGVPSESDRPTLPTEAVSAREGETSLQYECDRLMLAKVEALRVKKEEVSSTRFWPVWGLGFGAVSRGVRRVCSTSATSSMRRSVPEKAVGLANVWSKLPLATCARGGHENA